MYYPIYLRICQAPSRGKFANVSLVFMLAKRRQQHSHKHTYMIFRQNVIWWESIQVNDMHCTVAALLLNWKRVRSPDKGRGCSWERNMKHFWLQVISYIMLEMDQYQSVWDTMYFSIYIIRYAGFVLFKWSTFFRYWCEWKGGGGFGAIERALCISVETRGFLTSRWHWFSKILLSLSAISKYYDKHAVHFDWNMPITRYPFPLECTLWFMRIELV